MCPRSGEAVAAAGRLCRRCGAEFGGEAWYWCPCEPGRAGNATYEDEDVELRRVGPWVLGEVLGQGGVGIVYAARHLETGQEAAVKLMIGGLLATERQRRRFERELRTQAAIRDDGVVSILDAGSTPEGTRWIAMERLRGPSLAAVIDEGVGLSYREAAALTRAVAQALQRLHARGVYHRDIKPGNILLTAGGAPRIADFGLVMTPDATEALTRTGAIPGTPRYMAPEQREGAAEDWARVDVYALGLVLTELLEQGGETLSMSAAAPRRPPPRDLQWIAARAIEPDPALRTPSAGHLADDLGRWLRGARISRRPGVALQRARRWSRARRPALAAAAFGLGAAALIGGPRAADALEERRRDRATAARWAALSVALERADDPEVFARFVDDPEREGFYEVKTWWAAGGGRRARRGGAGPCGWRRRTTSGARGWGTWRRRRSSGPTGPPSPASMICWRPTTSA